MNAFHLQFRDVICNVDFVLVPPILYKSKKVITQQKTKVFGRLQPCGIENLSMYCKTYAMISSRLAMEPFTIFWSTLECSSSVRCSLSTNGNSSNSEIDPSL